MQYKIIKMQFPAGVHFGQRNLEDAGFELYADTIFSALCTEIVQEGEEKLNWFVNSAKKGELLFSDAFPFIKDNLYLPKPLKRIERKEVEQSSSVAKKIWKKVLYLQYQDLQNYLKGEMTDEKAKQSVEQFAGFGCSEVRTQADLQTKEVATPYRVGSFHFCEDCGLYFLLGYEKNEDYEKIVGYIQSLSYTGIGGRRSSGYGRFTAFAQEVPEKLKERIGTGSKTCMSLSVSLPKDDELDAVLPNSEVLWIKRSGFVTSLINTDTYRRRRDLYVMKSGSCVENTFAGDVYDVRNEAAGHAVYRYAKPLWLEV